MRVYGLLKDVQERKQRPRFTVKSMNCLMTMSTKVNETCRPQAPISYPCRLRIFIMYIRYGAGFILSSLLYENLDKCQG